MADLDAATQAALIAAEQRYRNALLWIRTIAGMHYFGGAFDPEHMRSLANIAANALDGKDLPDCLEASRAAMARAREQAAKWSDMFAEFDDDEEGHSATCTGCGGQFADSETGEYEFTTRERMNKLLRADGWTGDPVLCPACQPEEKP